MQSNFPGENMTIGGQPSEGRVARGCGEGGGFGGLLMRVRCFLPTKQSPIVFTSLKNFQTQMLCAHHAVVLDGSDS